MRFSDLDKFTRGNRANLADISRFVALNLICDQVIKEKIVGDVAEFGVYKGNTAFLLAKLARILGTTAYLFDTFEGFSLTDLKGIDADKKMEFADTSLARVRTLVGDQNVRFIRGHFPDSLVQLGPDLSFSVVHIDCDLCAPFKAALAYFYRRLVPGAFLIMHDYSSLYWPGAEKAIDEFFSDKPERVILIPDMAGTAVIRRIGATIDAINN